MYKILQPSYKVSFHQHLIQFYNQKIQNQKVNYLVKCNTVLDNILFSTKMLTSRKSNNSTDFLKHFIE